MAQLSSLLKRGILDELWYSAKSAGVGLEDAIRAFKSSRYEDIKGGHVLLNTSGGGYSASFDFRGMTPADCFELGQLYVEVLATVVADGASDDVAAYSAMLADSRLNGAGATYADFSNFTC